MYKLYWRKKGMWVWVLQRSKRLKTHLPILPRTKVKFHTAVQWSATIIQSFEVCLVFCASIWKNLLENSGFFPYFTLVTILNCKMQINVSTSKHLKDALHCQSVFYSACLICIAESSICWSPALLHLEPWLSSTEIL